MRLEKILQRNDVWRGSEAPSTTGIASGFWELDAALASEGWPSSALVEILTERVGIGEMRLLLPALAQLTRGDRWVVFIAPPFVPYAPALVRAGLDLSRVLVVSPKKNNDTLRAVEQALRAGTCGAVLAWPSSTDTKSLRRLQRAAEAGGALGILFRSTSVEKEHSPAALRLKVESADGEARRLAVQILKRRGGWPTGPVVLEVYRALVMRSSTRSAARDISTRRRYPSAYGHQPRPRVRTARRY